MRGDIKKTYWKTQSKKNLKSKSLLSESPDLVWNFMSVPFSTKNIKTKLKVQYQEAYTTQIVYLVGIKINYLRVFIAKNKYCFQIPIS